MNDPKGQHLRACFKMAAPEPSPPTTTHFMFPDGRWMGVDRATFITLAEHFVVLSDLSDAFSGSVPVVDLRSQHDMRTEELEFALDVVDAARRPSAYSPLGIARHMRRLSVLMPTALFGAKVVAYLLNTAPVVQWTGGSARLCDCLWFSRRKHRGQCMSVLHLGGTRALEWVLETATPAVDVVQGLRRQITRALHAAHEVEHAVGFAPGSMYVPIVRSALDRFASTACAANITTPRHMRDVFAALMPAVNAQNAPLACLTGTVLPDWAGLARNLTTGDVCTD